MKLPKRSFGMKGLLIFVTLAAFWMLACTELSKVTGHFEIKGNQLSVNEDGLVNGRLFYRFSRVRSDKPTQYFDFACDISNLPKPELAELKAGQRMKLRYRLYDFWPAKKQNVYAMFITDVLGVDEKHVVGHATMKGWTEVVINGSPGR